MTSRASKTEYELMAGGETVARLRWPSAWGSLAEATCTEETWTFKRVGFWRTRSTIRIAGSDGDIATFDPRWTGNGELTLVSGAKYRWEGTNLWATKFAWRDAAEQDLVQFGSSAGLTKMGATVEIRSAGAALADLPLLVLYGYYLLVMSHQDASATVAATSGAAVADTST